MFSQLLYSHRRRKAMSQEDLARRAGLTARSIRNLEGGSVRTPRPGTVQRLADSLSLDGADRERFESAAVATYLGERGVEPPVGVASSRPRFVVTEGMVTTAGGGLTVQWTHEARGSLPDSEFLVTIRGFTAPHTARRPADLLRAVLDALGAHAHDIPADPGAASVGAGPASGAGAAEPTLAASVGAGLSSAAEAVGGQEPVDARERRDSAPIP
jgi:transcriptional regulator with XRE-family HTH domain